MRADLEKLTGQRDMYRLELGISSWKEPALSFEPALGYRRKDVERCRTQLNEIIGGGIEHIGKLLTEADRELVPTKQSAERISECLRVGVSFAAHAEFSPRTEPLIGAKRGNVIRFPRRA